VNTNILVIRLTVVFFKNFFLSQAHDLIDFLAIVLITLIGIFLENQFMHLLMHKTDALYNELIDLG